jgi:hypothetical protein
MEEKMIARTFKPEPNRPTDFQPLITIEHVASLTFRLDLNLCPSDRSLLSHPVCARGTRKSKPSVCFHSFSTETAKEKF